AVAGVAPQPAVLPVLLLERRAEQGAVPLLRQGLPVQVVGGRRPALARPRPAAVLMHDDAPDLLHAVREPERVGDAELQLVGLIRGRVANLEVPAGGGRPPGEGQAQDASDEPQAAKFHGRWLLFTGVGDHWT